MKSKKHNVFSGLGIAGSFIGISLLGLMAYRFGQRKKVYNAMKNMYNTQLFVGKPGKEKSHQGISLIFKLNDFLGYKNPRPNSERKEELKNLENASVEEVESYIKKASSRIIPLIGIGSAKSTILKKQKLHFPNYKNTPGYNYGPSDPQLKSEVQQFYYKIPGDVYENLPIPSGKSILPTWSWENQIEKLKADVKHPHFHAIFLLHPSNYLDKDVDHIKELLFTATDWDKKH